MTILKTALDELSGLTFGFFGRRQETAKILFQQAQLAPLEDFIQADALKRLGSSTSQGEVYGRILATALARDGFWEGLNATASLRHLIQSNPYTFMPFLMLPDHADFFCSGPEGVDNLAWLARSRTPARSQSDPVYFSVPLDSPDPWPEEMLSGYYGKDNRADALRLAEPAWLKTLVQIGRLDEWICACLGAERPDRALAAAQASSGLSESGSSKIFSALLSARFPAKHSLEMAWGNAIPQKHSRHEREAHALAQSADGEAKAAIWQAIISGGAPIVQRAPPPSIAKDALPPRIADLSGAWVLKMEAARGGALDRESAWAWQEMSSSGLGAPVEKDAWDGRHGMQVARGLGLPADRVDLPLLLATHQGDRLNRALSGLADSGAWIEPSDEADISAKRGSSLIGALIEQGASSGGLRGALRMGAAAIDPPQSKPRLKSLLEFGGAPSDIEILLIAAGQSAQSLLSVDVDGSGPIHWASSALAADCIHFLAARGVSLSTRDLKGLSAGHWAAKRYSGTSAKEAQAALAALSEFGFDWASLDNKGLSALAALASKGPISTLASAIKANPEAIHAKGLTAPSAADILRRRGGESLAEFERMVFSIGAPESSAPTSAIKNQRRL